MILLSVSLPLLSGCLPALPEPSTLTGDGGAGADTDDTDESGDTGETGATDCIAVEEVCNGVDDDCDAEIDEGVLSTWYIDADADGYGDDATETAACTAPTSGVAVGGDCNDASSGVNPGARQSYGLGVDDDCDSYFIAQDFEAGTVDDAVEGDAGWICTATGTCTPSYSDEQAQSGTQSLYTGRPGSSSSGAAWWEDAGFGRDFALALSFYDGGGIAGGEWGFSMGEGDVASIEACEHDIFGMTTSGSAYTGFSQTCGNGFNNASGTLTTGSMGWHSLTIIALYADDSSGVVTVCVDGPACWSAPFSAALGFIQVNDDDDSFFVDDLTARGG